VSLFELLIEAAEDTSVLLTVFVALISAIVMTLLQETVKML
jgi:hypothetical protein